MLGLAREAGVAPNTITNAERGRTQLSYEAAVKIAPVLGVEPERITVNDPAHRYRPSADDSSLRRRRHQLRLSTREAARRIGVSRSALLRAEQGRGVRERNALRIAEFYGLSPVEVIGGRPLGTSSRSHNT